MDSVTARERVDYGIDAPGVVQGQAIGGGAGIILGIILYRALRSARPVLARILLAWGLLGGGSSLVAAAVMAWSSKVGKLRARDRVLAAIPWRGDETLLDVGCGRGLLLIAAAKRLTTGKAIGVDIWKSVDQSGNRPEATWANARAEGVADRIDVRDGDATALPFQDGVFDVVVSSLVLHNMHHAGERQQAVREMVRVLKPGGYVAIFDILHTDEYAHVLHDSGMIDTRRSGSHFLFFFPARTVTARKPAPSS